MRFDRRKFFAGVREHFGPLNQEQVDGLSFLVGSFEDDPQWKDVRHTAYALATVKHETANKYQPIREYRSKPGSKGRANQDRYWLTGYYGRGYVQLTWKRNYELFGIADNPDAALSPVGAYKILSVGMQKGSFTGKKLSDFIKGSTTDYHNARKVINGLDKAGLIAGYAKDFEKILRSSQTDSAAHQPTDTTISLSSPGIEQGEAAGTSAEAQSAADTTTGQTIKAEITPDGGVKVESQEGPPAPKERIAVVQTQPQKWSSRVAAKITGVVTGNALFQWVWSQMEKLQGLKLHDSVWIIVSLTIAIGSLLWIIHEIVNTWRENKRQEKIDELLVKENSTVNNLVQLIPHDEAELYRARGFKIITRGEKA